MGDASRYGHYSQRCLKREKRTLPIYGEYEDTSKYYRCWNCGMINSIDRAPSNSGGDGISVVDFPEISTGSYLYGDAPNIILDDFVTVYSNGLDGNVLTYVRHGQYGKAVNGCAFCGTLNYR